MCWNLCGEFVITYICLTRHLIGFETANVFIVEWTLKRSRKVCVMFGIRVCPCFGACTLSLYPLLVCQCHLASRPAHCGLQLDANLSVSDTLCFHLKQSRSRDTWPHTHSLFLYEWVIQMAVSDAKSAHCECCIHLLSLNRQTACIIFSHYYFKDIWAACFNAWISLQLLLWHSTCSCAGRVFIVWCEIYLFVNANSCNRGLLIFQNHTCHTPSL